MKSPRRAVSSATRAGPTKPRAPRRCRICPNQPLKAACSCPKRNQTRKPSKNSGGAVDTIPVPTVTISRTQGEDMSVDTCVDRPVEPCVPHTYTLPTPVSTVFESRTQGDGASVDCPVEPGGPQADTLYPAPVSTVSESRTQGDDAPVPQPLGPCDPLVPETASTPTTVVARLPVTHLNTLPENNLWNADILCLPPQDSSPTGMASVPFHASNTLDPSSLHDHGEPTGNCEPALNPMNSAATEDVQSDEDRLKYGKRLPREARIREYGMVQGAMRGNTEYSVVRQNKLRDPISDASTATTRFNRELPLIIARAERLAHETDSYVLILAQQATGSSAAVHFSSSRLRREAFGDSSRMVNEFQNLMTRLVIAKRSANLALARELEMSKKELAVAQQKIVHADLIATNATNRNIAELNVARAMNRDLLEKLEELRNRMS